MNTHTDSIRPVQPSDLPVLKEIVSANAMFPPEMLDGMIAPFFDQGEQAGFWLTYEAQLLPRAVAFYAPEPMTSGTWNLYLIAVNPKDHSRGMGRALMAYIETHLARMGQRVLLVETSGLAHFERTRSFYLKCGYTKEATIREFYAAGEDKIVFWKDLSKVIA